MSNLVTWTWQSIRKNKNFQTNWSEQDCKIKWIYHKNPMLWGGKNNFMLKLYLCGIMDNTKTETNEIRYKYFLWEGIGMLYIHASFGRCRHTPCAETFDVK